MTVVKSIVKSIIDKGKMHVFHKEQNKEARRMLRLVENEKGKLSSVNKKLCNEYALDVFGDKKYAPWLMVYCAHAGEFKKGWIPDNYYGEVVVSSLKGGYGQVCNRIAIINKLLGKSNSLDICYYVNQLFLNPNYEILDVKELKKFLFRDNSKVVFKIEDSFQGKGIYIFDKNNFNFDDIIRLGNGVFQKYIKQHPFFSEFQKSSVATIRLTSTCDNNGNIDVQAGFFKFGRKKDTHVKTASAIKIPIDINTGKLFSEAYLPNGSSTKHLPDNDISFAGKIIPSFNDCIAEVKKLHKLIPYVRCIGWDIIVDENDKIRLIELNGGHNGIKFHEMVQGPCFLGLNWESLINKK